MRAHTPASAASPKPTDTSTIEAAIMQPPCVRWGTGPERQPKKVGCVFTESAASFRFRQNLIAARGRRVPIVVGL